MNPTWAPNGAGCPFRNRSGRRTCLRAAEGPGPSTAGYAAPSGGRSRACRRLCAPPARCPLRFRRAPGVGRFAEPFQVAPSTCQTQPANLPERDRAGPSAGRQCTHRMREGAGVSRERPRLWKQGRNGCTTRHQPRPLHDERSRPPQAAPPGRDRRSTATLCPTSAENVTSFLTVQWVR